MKPIHNLLRQRLYRTQKPIIEHPPMDLLGAFAEKALSGSDSAPVLGHLAHCGDCREIVFLASPEIVGAGTVGSPTNLPSRGGWISWPVFRWGSVAACAVIVVAAMRLHPSHPENRSEVTISAAQSQQTVQTSVTEASSRGANLLPKVSTVKRDQERAPARRLHGIPGKAKAVPEVLNPTSDDRQKALLLPDSAGDMRNPRPRWILAADGTLQRSLDGGISWKQIHVAHDRVFRAVAAAGRSVWLGGQRGVLFHSTDAGQHWAQMKPTANRPLPDSDIIGIEFDDELHGKLTTARAESWTTSDAGRSWEKQ